MGRRSGVRAYGQNLDSCKDANDVLVQRAEYSLGQRFDCSVTGWDNEADFLAGGQIRYGRHGELFAFESDTVLNGGLNWDESDGSANDSGAASAVTSVYVFESGPSRGSTGDIMACVTSGTSNILIVILSSPAVIFWIDAVASNNRH